MHLFVAVAVEHPGRVVVAHDEEDVFFCGHDGTL